LKIVNTNSTAFKKSDEGRYVIYQNDGGGREELGRIKTVQSDEYAFIVYNCNKEWRNYKNYTAARTHITNVRFLK